MEHARRARLPWHNCMLHIGVAFIVAAAVHVRKRKACTLSFCMSLPLLPVGYLNFMRAKTGEQFVNIISFASGKGVTDIGNVDDDDDAHDT